MTANAFTITKALPRENLRPIWFCYHEGLATHCLSIAHNYLIYKSIKRLETDIKKLKEIIGDQQVELIGKNELNRLAEDESGEDFGKKAIIPFCLTVKGERTVHGIAMARLNTYCNISRQDFHQAAIPPESSRLIFYFS